MPALQTADAPAIELGQTLPQPPQLLRVLSAVSQPLRALPSQLPKPLLQTGAQALPVQLVLPWALLQAAPQLPQFAVFVARVTSQPFKAVVSQSPKPGLQPAMPQLLLVQRGLPLAAVQALLQKPQSARVLLRSVSQSAGFASQSPLPCGQFET
jgi:hypothetical protein